MPFPFRVQEKIRVYTNILLDRYPPSIPYYKLSIGYTKDSEAISDLTPNSSVYTRNDLAPDIGETIYIDGLKTSKFEGGDLYYHVFDSGGSDLLYIVQIDSGGIVTFKS